MSSRRRPLLTLILLILASGILTTLFSPASQAQVTFTPIRVNAGGGAYTDSQGYAWSADTGFTASNTFSTTSSINNTTDPTLYQTLRYGPGFTYQFTVPNGNYNVTLKFAETYYTTTGEREFNVILNGTQVLTNFDVIAAAGAPLTAIDQTFPVPVTNGTITIQFTQGVIDYPIVNAIAITAASGVAVQVSPTSASLSASQTQQFTASVTGTTNTAVTWSMNPSAGTLSSTGLYTAPSSISAAQNVTVTATSQADTAQSASAMASLQPPAGTFTPVRVNAGGGAYTDSQGYAWSADTGFTASNTFSTTSSINNTTDPTLYQTLRYGPGFTYQFTVPNGNYNVTLKFAETYYTTTGEREFNVILNGTQVLTNFDVIAAAGAPLTAIDETFPVSVTNGTITIQLTQGVIDYPIVNAIAITAATASGGVAVQVSPTTASLSASQTQQFTAAVSGTTNTAVTWSMNPSVGTLSSTGLYTAPSSISAAQNVTVTATSQADTTQSASATVSLDAPDFNVTFNPASVNLTPGGSDTVDISATGQNGFSGTVAVAISGLPSGVTASTTNFNLQPGGDTKVTFSASQSAGSISTSLTVDASSGSIDHGYQLPLTVVAPATIPGLVSDRSGNISRTNAIGATEYGCTANAYCIPYVYPAASGDLGIVSFTFNYTANPTVSDDKGSSYTCIGAATQDTSSGIDANACYSTSLAANAHYATVSSIDSGDSNVSAKAADFYNTGAFDTSATNGSGTATSTMNAGSITPSSGDLLYVYICRTGQAKGTNTGGTFTPATQTGITWHLLTTDSIDGCMDMWGIWSGTGAINPQVTSSTSTTYAGLVLAFKAATTATGTAPSGMYISKIQSEMTPTGSAQATWAEQFATGGNLAAFIVEGGTTQFVSSITDANRTWSEIGAPLIYPNNADYDSDSTWYAPNLSADATGAMTVNVGGTSSGNGDVGGLWFDIVGAAAAPLGNFLSFNNTNDTGTGATQAWIPSAIAFQPGVSSGIVLAVGSQAFNTSTGLTAPSGGIFTAAMACSSLSGPCSVDQNNLASFVPISSSAPLEFTVNQADSGTAVGQHASQTVSFLANGASAATGISFAANECVDPSTSQGTYTCTFKAVHTNDVIAVMTQSIDTSGSVSISDSCSNTWALIDGPLFPHSNMMAAWYATAKNTNACTITVTYPATTTFHEIGICDMQGVTTLDQHNLASVTSGSGGATTGTSVTTSHASEIAWSYGLSDGNFDNGATGHWQFMDDSNGNGQEFQILTSTGLIAGQFTDSGGSGLTEGVGIATFY